MHKLWRGSATAPVPSTAFSTALQLHSNSSSKPLLFPFLSDSPPMPALHLRSPASSFAAAFGTSLHCRRTLPCRCSGGGLHPKRAWSPLLRRQLPDSPPWSVVASNTRVFGTEADGLVAEKGGIFEASDEHARAQELEQQHVGGAGSGRLVERKQRSRSAAAARAQECDGPPVGNLELLTIPGVGPRNLRKLVDKGFEGVAQLKQLYRDKFFGKSTEKMVEFLRNSIGIVHKNHAESITTFIKERVDEELKGENGAQNKVTQKKRLTFCVEGNISVGKTTFLQRIANETLELRDLVEIVPEPISKWQDVGPDHFNILDAFYNEPQRYAYTFQNYVFVTRVMQERESSSGIKPLRLMERSIFSDRMVFVRAVHEANWMNEMEISIYDSWFDPVVSSLPGLIPDGFIYLRASPDTCHKRMMVRKRAEEGGVTLDYLKDLHEKHESWLFPFQSGNHGVLSITQLPMHMDSSLHPDIRDRIFYLEGNHLHSCIQKVPALVLDCEPNVDFNKDIDAKRRYARQVAEFFEFVKRKQAETFSDSETDAQNKSQQVMLPHEGHFWVPNDTLVPSSTRDIRTAMPFLSG